MTVHDADGMTYTVQPDGRYRSEDGYLFTLNGATLTDGDMTIDVVANGGAGMNERTAELLALAGELGATVVGIGNTRHPLLKNEGHPFHHDRQIFTPPAERVRDRVWDSPVAWVLAKRFGIRDGCGNSGQCQAITAGLDLGVWIKLVDGWGRIA